MLMKSLKQDEKIERENERETDKAEIKNAIVNEIAPLKQDVDRIEQKTESLNKKVDIAKLEMNEKYDGLAEHIKKMEEKIKDLDGKAAGKETQTEERMKDGVVIENVGPKQAVQFVASCPAASQPEGSLVSSSHPRFVSSDRGVGRSSLSFQPSAEDERIREIAKKGKRTIGIGPIPEDWIQEVMEEQGLSNHGDGVLATVYDFLKYELSMPAEGIKELTISRIFHLPGEGQKEKVYIEFTKDYMPKIMFRYIEKLSKKLNMFNYIPEEFMERWKALDNLAFQLRHAEPAYKTKIRWGGEDIVLERKLKSQPKDPYRLVTVTDLPAVNLSPPPVLPRPTTSPAPGRPDRRRNKRVRSGSVEEQQQQSKHSKKEEVKGGMGDKNHPSQGLEERNHVEQVDNKLQSSREVDNESKNSSDEDQKSSTTSCDSTSVPKPDFQ